MEGLVRGEGFATDASIIKQSRSVRFSESGRSACQLPVSRNVKRSLQVARMVSGESYTTDKAGGFNSVHQSRKFNLAPLCPTSQLVTHSAKEYFTRVI
jgi:hypothetical protein